MVQTARPPASTELHRGAGWGLEPDEVEARRRAGAINRVARSSSRSVAQILRANLLTRFNAILGTLLLVTLVVGPLQDATFGFILLANAVIGITQELRAKAVLERLALVTAERARVVRAGALHDVAVEGVVADDVVDLGPGDQLAVDGEVLESLGLAVDESLLTGESEPRAKQAGSTVLSGSFVIAGSGRYRATRVGTAAFAEQLAASARRFAMARSELRHGIDVLLTIGAWLLVPTGVVLVVGQFRADLPVIDAVRTSVAGMVAMIPAGLVLLTSIAFAASVVRLGRHQTLVQELQSVETLARVDVVCIDKTGTLTESAFTVTRVEELSGGAPVGAALAVLAAAERHPNATLRAIAAAVAAPPDDWTILASVPFSSGRGWSAVAAGGAGQGTWVLGAPEILTAAMPSGEGVRDRAATHARAGSRVVLLAWSPRPAGDELPAPLQPLALVVLSERLRSDAAATVRYFAEQGVELRVLSGDSPATAAAVAQRAGIAVAGAPCDARELPDDPDVRVRAVEETAVFGRVTPERKRDLVAALQSSGHTVAMVGDGVNDVLALKQADIGIAMSGSTAATRAVAQLVLLGEGFAALPAVVGEGRRVIAGVERASKIFVTQTAYGMLLAWAVGCAAMPFPFLSRHLSYVVSFTVGIPSLFLALGRSAERARPGFVGRVLAFSIPAGVVAALATFVSYRLALADAPSTTLDEARTTAAIVLCAVGLWLLTALDRPLRPQRALLVAVMAVLFAISFAMPVVRSYFGLAPPRPLVWLAAMGLVWMTVGAIELGWRLVDALRQRSAAPGAGSP